MKPEDPLTYAVCVKRSESFEAWAARIGADATRYRERRRRFLWWGWVLPLPTVLVLVIAVVVFMVGWPSVAVGSAMATTVLALVGVFMFSGWAGLVGVARQDRCRAEGLALLALGAYVPGLPAYEMRLHLRDLAGFDAWAKAAGVGAPLTATPQSTDWGPDISRPILPGPAADRWLQWVVITAFAVFVSGAFWFFRFVIAAMENRADEWLPVAFGLFAACTVAIVAFSIAVFTRLETEYRNGYATVVAQGQAGNLFDFRVGVDLVDSKTGYVFRQALAAPMDSDTYRARFLAIRAAHPDARPTRLEQAV